MGVRENVVWLLLVFFCCCCARLNGNETKVNGLTLSVIHFNDFHARYEEVSNFSGVCKEGELCHGGIARLSTAVNELKIIRKNPIVLNAGDAFQGSLYYNLFKWNVTQDFLNALPITAHTIGNHEFDDEIAGLVPFLKALKAPVVLANINDTLHPEIQGLYKKSIVVQVDGKKIGIVGIIASTTNELSNTENIIFEDEVESMNREAERLVEEEGVFTVVVLSHCGYLEDQRIAKSASKRIGLIVGSHSHTLLYTGTPPDNSTAEGPYPTVIQRNLDGKNVLIVQASAYTRYLGDIVIKYGEDGEVISHRGNPIYLSREIQPDPEFVAKLAPYKAVVDAAGGEVIGETEVFLGNGECRSQECVFGDFITDAMVSCANSGASNKTPITLALINGGGIRTAIPIGNITFNDLMSAQPFESTFDLATFKGSAIKAIFERTVLPSNNGDNILQVSGFEVTYDLSKMGGERVVGVRVKNPQFGAYEDLEMNKDYKIAITSFLVHGGDGFKEIPAGMKDHKVGVKDVECLKGYIQEKTPIRLSVEGRLMFLNQQGLNSL